MGYQLIKCLRFRFVVVVHLYSCPEKALIAICNKVLVGQAKSFDCINLVIEFWPVNEVVWHIPKELIEQLASNVLLENVFEIKRQTRVFGGGRPIKQKWDN